MTPAPPSPQLPGWGCWCCPARTRPQEEEDKGLCQPLPCGTGEWGPVPLESWSHVGLTLCRYISFSCVCSGTKRQCGCSGPSIQHPKSLKLLGPLDQSCWIPSLLLFCSPGTGTAERPQPFLLPHTPLKKNLSSSAGKCIQDVSLKI